MAGIDKIYGTQEQRRLLKNLLLRKHKRNWLKNLYPKGRKDKNKIVIISNFNSLQDKILYKMCKKIPKMSFIIERIEEQYGDNLKSLLLGHYDECPKCINWKFRGCDKCSGK